MRLFPVIHPLAERRPYGGYSGEVAGEGKSATHKRIFR